MISMYADLLMPNEVEKYFQEIHVASLRPNKHVYRKMIYMYCHLLREDMVTKLMNRMKEEKLTPDNIIVNSIFRMYSALGEVDKANDILGNLEKYHLEPDEWTYYARIYQHISNKKYRSALTLYNEMKEREIKPTPLTLCRLVAACKELGHYDRAIELYETCKEEGALLNPAFNAAILSYGRTGNLEEAEKTFQLAKEMDEHNEYTYEALMLLYVRPGWTDRITRLFDELLAEGLRPSLSLYHLLVFQYSSEGQRARIEQVLELLEEDAKDAEMGFFRSKGLVDPRPGFRRRLLNMEWSQRFCSAVLRQYEKLHKPENAVTLLKRMEKRRIGLDYASYNALVDLYNRLPAGDTAIQLFELMKKVGINDEQFSRGSQRKLNKSAE